MSRPWYTKPLYHGDRAEYEDDIQAWQMSEEDRKEIEHARRWLATHGRVKHGRNRKKINTHSE